MSEMDYIKAQMEEAHEARLQERRDARAYVLRKYEVLGMDEADRDEVLACLGILTEQDVEENPGSYVARALSRGGLASGLAKPLTPRTPPSRAQ